LIRAGEIGGAEYASRFVPSAGVQLARQAALPDPDELGARVREAAAGLPFRPGAFQPFIDDVAASRELQPLTRGAISSQVIKARLDPLLFERDNRWFGIVAVSDVRDPSVLVEAISRLDEPGLSFIDIKAETNQVAASYTREAARWVGVGCLAVFVALWVGLRRPSRAIRVAAPILGALVLTLATLSALQIELTLFHLVSLLLMVGVSLDYALFFNRRTDNIEDAARTFRALLNCNIATLATFGLLTFCRTPILRGIGSAVALGVLYSIILTFVFAAPCKTEASSVR
jgi:predicted exporter